MFDQSAATPVYRAETYRRIETENGEPWLNNRSFHGDRFALPNTFTYSSFDERRFQEELKLAIHTATEDFKIDHDYCHQIRIVEYTDYLNPDTIWGTEDNESRIIEFIDIERLAEAA